MRKLLIIFLSCVLVNVHSFAVNVVFRLDDPTISTDSITMRVLHLFNVKEVPLTIAMIPCDSAEQPYIVTDSTYLKELQKPNIEIALHGYNHADINQRGEFGSLDLAETNRRIKLGKEILESQLGKEIVTFIPPFNAINEYVPQVMLENGLYVLSSNIYGNAYENGIQYFPETLDKSISKKGFVSAAVDAIDKGWDDEVCVLMFHHYDFTHEKSWIRLNNILDSCITNPNIELHTFRSLFESGKYSSCHRYRANQLRSGLQKYCLHEDVLHTTWLCWLVHVLNALMYALLPLLLLVGWYSHRKPLWLIVAILGCLSFGGMALWSVMGPMKLLALDMVYVAIVGVVLWIVGRIRCKK